MKYPESTSRQHAAERTAAERSHTLFRRQVAGLLILAALVLVVALLRSNVHDLLPPGWWRLW
jgi:hypothetical protein